MSYDDYRPEMLQEYVERTLKALTLFSEHFDSIAVRGVSGLIVGSPVALRMGKPVVIIRKEGVSSHADGLVTNFRSIGDRYVIVDDFVSSGGTKQAILDQIKQETFRPPRWWETSRRHNPPRFSGLYQYLYNQWLDGRHPERFASEAYEHPQLVPAYKEQ